MAIFLRDEGDVSVFLTEDGQEVRVAKEYAQPYALGAEQAPPVPEPTAPDLSLAAQGAPQLPQDIGPDLPPPSPAPTPVPDAPLSSPSEITMAPEDLRPAEQQPIAEPEVTFQPDDLRPPPPDILPQSVPSSPTGLAKAINQGDQQKSDAAFRTGEAKAGALEQIAAANEAADAKIAEQERLQEEERKQRQLDEQALNDDYGRLLKKHENFRVDPTRGMSGDRQTWAWIAAAISGLGRVVSGRDPSSNPGLDTLMKQFDVRVQHQMAEQDALGNTIGMKRQELTDFRGATKDRLAQYDLRMAGELNRAARTAETVGKRAAAVSEREAAKEVAATLRQEATARLGSAAAQEAEMRARARAARAAAMAHAQKAAEEQRRFMAKEKVKVGPDGNYIPDPAFAADQGPLLAPEQIKQLYGVDVPVAMTQGQLDKHLGTSKAAADATKAGVEASQVQGTPNAINDQEGKPFLKKDGTPFQVADAKRREKIDNINSAAQNVRRIADLVSILKKKYGGASEARGSAEYQELNGLIAATDFETYKAFGLGAPSSGDQAMAANARGGKDITSFIYDATSGLESYAQNIEAKLNTEMRTAGYDGAPVKLKRVEEADADERTPTENLQLYVAAEIGSSDTDIAKRAAARAAAAVPAMAKQLSPSALGHMAVLNKERLEAGLLSKKEAAAAHEAFRAELRRKLAKETQEAAESGRPGSTPASIELTDERIDEMLGVTAPDTDRRFGVRGD